MKGGRCSREASSSALVALQAFSFRRLLRCVCLLDPISIDSGRATLWAHNRDLNWASFYLQISFFSYINLTSHSSNGSKNLWNFALACVSF